MQYYPRALAAITKYVHGATFASRL
jgi:hypothetical protein